MLVVIGCGNPARRDDGVGTEVVKRLARLHPETDASLRLIDAGTSGMEVMFQVRGANRAVIVDACRSGGEPGAVYRLPAREAATPVEHGYSMHGLRWDHALHAAQKMHGDDVLDRIEVFLVEAADLGFGLELSEAAERGVALVVERIGELLAQPEPRA